MIQNVCAPADYGNIWFYYWLKHSSKRRCSEQAPIGFLHTEGKPELLFPIPDNEICRLAALDKLGLFHSLGGPEFDSIAELARDFLDCPISLISLIGEHEQRFFAAKGLGIERCERSISFCNYTILGSGSLVINDASKDPRFVNNPLVIGNPNIKFYAGYPISIDGVHALGTIGVIDTKPRKLSPDQSHQLRKLGVLVENLIRNAQTAREASAVAAEASLLKKKYQSHAKRQAQIANVSGVGSWEISLDDMGLSWTAQTKKIHQVSNDYVPTVEEAINFYAPSARGTIKQAVDEGILTGKKWNLELPLITAKGKNIWVRAIGEPVQEGSKTTGLVGTFEDITERKKAELQLINSENLARIRTEELQVTLANMKQGVSVFDENAKLILWNERYIEIFEKPQGEIWEGVPFKDLIDAEKIRGDIDGDVDEMIDELRTLLIAGETVERMIHQKSGKIISSVHAPMPGGGWVGTHEDITLEAESSRQIEYAAHHDLLTGLANRAKFNIEIKKLIENSELRKGGIMLMLVDLDRFKNVNDTFGNAMGDELLAAVAKRISASVRPSDMVARLGGDEFAILVHCGNIPRKNLAVIANRIVKETSNCFMLEENRIEIGASIGISIINDDNYDLETVLAQADSALHKVKQNGRSEFRFFDDKLHKEVSQKRSRISALAQVTRDKSFEVHYQPIFSLENQKLDAYEALLRWDSPHHEYLNPSDFIPLAEETGLILEIGEWVLETAIREARHWPENISLALNISPRQLGIGRLKNQVRDALNRWKFEPSRLELEVTEHTMLRDDDATTAELYELKELGIKIALDDFGTGYSSLSYLNRFPFDKLKIDRSFISGFECDQQRSAIVCSVASLASSLGIESTAEGIESENQIELLRQAGCTYAQGFHLGYPQHASELEHCDLLLNPAMGRRLIA